MSKTKLAHVAAYMDNSEKKELEKIAKDESRSLSSLVSKILRDFLKKQKKA